MQKYKPWFSAVVMMYMLLACGDTRQQAAQNKNSDSTGQASAIAKPAIRQKITPSLWVDKDAKAVVDYYLSIFKQGKMKAYHQYKNPPEAKAFGGQDNFETAVMEIGDMEFNILAAGPYFKFNESVSFVINCKDQAEVDYYWNALTTNGGQEGSCGWLKDKYGLSWQVVPVEYYDLINNDDPQVREKAMRNTLKQKKLILSELK
jgi:predicted 3-demethylubiquinone-9 3-methyltransferase (glyoxalase superfamily)